MRRYIPKQGAIISGNFSLTNETTDKEAQFALVVNVDILSETSVFAWIVPITNEEQCYPTHILLEGRMKTKGILKIEQLQYLDYSEQAIRFVEKCPESILQFVSQSIKELVTVTFG